MGLRLAIRPPHLRSVRPRAPGLQRDTALGTVVFGVLREPADRRLAVGALEIEDVLEQPPLQVPPDVRCEGRFLVTLPSFDELLRSRLGVGRPLSPPRLEIASERVGIEVDVDHRLGSCASRWSTSFSAAVRTLRSASSRLPAMRSVITERSNWRANPSIWLGGPAGTRSRTWPATTSSRA